MTATGRFREFGALSNSHLGGRWAMLAEHRRWLCQQYPGYRSLAPRQAGLLNDRDGAETVSWASIGE